MACLDKKHNLLFGESGIDPPLRLQIRLVAGDGQADLGSQHLPELLDPVLDLAKAVLVGDVVDEDCAVGVAIVDRAEGVEPLLARRVPDRQVDAFASSKAQLLVQEGGLEWKWGEKS